MTFSHQRSTQASAKIVKHKPMELTHTRRRHYHVELFDKDGNLKAQTEFENFDTNVGREYIQNNFWAGTSYTAAFYVMLIDSTPTFNAADTMASHAGWAEITDYDEGARPQLTMGTASAGVISNTASKATYTITTGGTAIGGMAITTNSTKGGTTGTLIAGAAFSDGDITPSASDSLQVTITDTIS